MPPNTVNDELPPLLMSVDIPFYTPQLAQIAYDVMRVDKEPKRSTTTRSLSVNNSILHVEFKSSDLKNLRVASTSFFKHLSLVLKTVDLLGPPASDSYDHY